MSIRDKGQRMRIGNILLRSSLSIFVSLLMVGCAGAPAPAPRLEKQEVVKEINLYTRSIDRFGEMAEIYGTTPLYVQTKGVVDDTGVSKGITSTGEIPYDITEMIKSAVNNIGQKVTLIDYDPSHQSNMMALGYTQFQDKIKPDVVISGGITEYDRSLLNTKTGADADVESGNFGLSGGASTANSMDRITIDINLIDFDTWAMIPKMNATNSIKVYMGKNSVSLGFSILANAFGLNGSVKEIQGRHAAVRMLVDMSVIEVLGRDLHLPYWRILPNGQEDTVVIRAVKRVYEAADEVTKIAMLQRVLYLHGYDLEINGIMDEATSDAIQELSSDEKGEVVKADHRDLFMQLYLSIPLKNNFRNMAIFGPLEAPGAVTEEQHASVATPVQAASQDVAQSPQDLVSFQEVLSDKKITAVGIYKNRNEMIALQMATNVAINNLAKKVGKVLQEEETSLKNDQLTMIMTTHAQNVINGYEKIAEKYDRKSGRAEVTIQLEGSVLAGTLEKLID